MVGRFTTIRADLSAKASTWTLKLCGIVWLKYKRLDG